MAEMHCSTLICRRKKPDEQRSKFFRKRTNKGGHLWPKYKFTHFGLARKFCSIIFDCYSANILQILIAQNNISGVLKKAEPGSSNICDSDRTIISFTEYSSIALYFPDLNSTLEFSESSGNPHTLPEYFIYPFTFLTIFCKRREYSSIYQLKWFLSKSLTMEAALSLPQLTPSSTITVDVSSISSPTQYNRTRVSFHCTTTNFILHYLRKLSQFTISTDSNSLKSPSLWQFDYEYFNLLKFLFLLIILLAKGSNALLLSGAPGSYIR